MMVCLEKMNLEKKEKNCVIGESTLQKNQKLNKQEKKNQTTYQ